MAVKCKWRAGGGSRAGWTGQSQNLQGRSRTSFPIVRTRRKTMRTVIALLAFCFTSLIAQGQEGCREPKIVKTTGTAELKVTPDKAMLQLGVERQSATARNAKAEVANTSRKILAALKDLNIEQKDIQTAYLYLEPMIDYRKGLRPRTSVFQMRRDREPHPPPPEN